MSSNFNYKQTPGRVKLANYTSENENPLISIITPFYNSKEYFSQTFNSVVNQTFPYFEWIIVDDGSIDKEAISLLEELGEVEKRIRIFHIENVGPSAARNYAINQSQAEIVVPLDADDLIEPTYLECVYWSLYTNPEASWSYTDSVGFQNEEYLWKKPFNSKLMKVENLLTCTAGIRKKDLYEVGLYATSETYFNEDWHLWLKLLNAKKIPVHMGWYGFWYRRTNNGVLGHLKSNRSDQKKSSYLIKDIGRSITDIKAIEFPRYNLKKGFPKPRKWDWDRAPINVSTKAKVLMILPHMVMGGADLFNLDIVSRINKQKFELSIITTNPGDSTWRQRFEKHVTDIFDLTTFLDMEYWGSFIHYYITSRKIDILFVSNSYFGYYLIPWLRKEFPDISIIDYVHMEEWYWRAGGYARTSGALGDFIEKTYVCNDHLRHVMIESFDKKDHEAETVYIGVDEEEFNPDYIEEGQIRASLNVNQDQPLILFPCRLHPQKRPFLMVEIVKKLKALVPNVIVVVVGDGPQWDELLAVIKKEKLQQTIYCVGRKDDMRPYYRDSQVTLVCSLKEGLSLTAYESLAMGVPVVSSDVGGQKELINSEVGRVIPLYQNEEADLDNRHFMQEEVDEYVAALFNILSMEKEDKEKLSKQCRERIEQGFTKTNMIRYFEEEFTAWKYQRSKEKNRGMSEHLKAFPRLINDYVSLYIEYEITAISSNRVFQFLSYIKGVLMLKKNPLSLVKDIVYFSKNKYYFKRYLYSFKSNPLFQFITKLININR